MGSDLTYEKQIVEVGNNSRANKARQVTADSELTGRDLAATTGPLGGSDDLVTRVTRLSQRHKLATSLGREGKV